jgi:hypothetical protein
VLATKFRADARADAHGSGPAGCRSVMTPSSARYSRNRTLRVGTGDRSFSLRCDLGRQEMVHMAEGRRQWLRYLCPTNSTVPATA